MKEIEKKTPLKVACKRNLAKKRGKPKLALPRPQKFASPKKQLFLK